MFIYAIEIYEKNKYSYICIIIKSGYLVYGVVKE